MRSDATERSELLTRSAVENEKVQDISGAALGRARCAEADLALLERGGEGSDGESEDGGEEHLDFGGEMGSEDWWESGSKLD